jgi:hypothetical protein
MASRVGLTAAALLVIALVSPSASDAKGTVRIQQPSGAATVYKNVNIEVVKNTLRIITADRKGVLVITDAACSFVGKIMRCLPYSYVLEQSGTHPLDFEHGTIYYNPTQTKQKMSHSSSQLEPNGVLVAVKSKRGTYVSVTGTLDKRSQ